MDWNEFLNILSKNDVEHNLSKNIPERALWGVAPTGNIHIGYLQNIGILKLLKKFGTKVILPIADYHAYMDSEKTKWEELSNKTHYYLNVLEGFGFKKEREMVVLSEIYTQKSYIEGFYQFSRKLPGEDLIKYAGTTLKSNSTKDYRFSDFLYVATQIYDIIYFDIDFVLSGQDESGIYRLGLPITDKVGNKTFFAYCPNNHGLYKKEMHASDDKSNNITVHDELDTITEKIEVYLQRCLRINTKPILIYRLENSIFPLFNIKQENSIKDILKEYQEKDVSYLSEKVSEKLDKILKPVRTNLKKELLL